MVVNQLDDRSTSTIDGDLESKRSLLTKLYHAAYCHHEGYSLETHCSADPLCCATKRLFEHMNFCVSSNCGVPRCRDCRRVWRHYQKCDRLQACRLCSVLSTPYSSTGLAPRFARLISRNSVTSQPSAKSPSSTLWNPPTIPSTAAVAPKKSSSASPSPVTPPPSSLKPPTIVTPPRPVDGKENNTTAATASISAVRSSNGNADNIHQSQLSRDAFSKQEQMKKKPKVSPSTSPTNHATNNIINNSNNNSNNRVLRGPAARRAGSSPKNSGMSKPPLSPRRPQWALF